MTTTTIATNAASSGIQLDRKLVKQLAQRSDRPGLIWLTQWVVALALAGTAVHFALGTYWFIPAMIVYGTLLTVPTYALSHECAHGTAFRTRWINEVCLWIGSLIYFEEPYHRRYSHTHHHTYTWHVGKDSQMPFDTPMTFRGWLLDVLGIAMAVYEAKIFLRNAAGYFSDATKTYTPPTELPKLKWGARACLAVYATLVALIVLGYDWPLYYVILPRLVGAPILGLFTVLQHVEMQENSPSIMESTRSFRTSWPVRFLYMNMNNHVEHHLYPQVPFHSLPELSTATQELLPKPDPGFLRTNLEVLSVVIRRSLGWSTKAASIRQAPHMITEGGFAPIAAATMR